MLKLKSLSILTLFSLNLLNAQKAQAPVAQPVHAAQPIVTKPAPEFKTISTSF